MTVSLKFNKTDKLNLKENVTITLLARCYCGRRHGKAESRIPTLLIERCESRPLAPPSKHELDLIDRYFADIFIIMWTFFIGVVQPANVLQCLVIRIVLLKYPSYFVVYVYIPNQWKVWIKCGINRIPWTNPHVK